MVHEFGHFFAAKKFGIRVDEFGFGFPPKIFGKKFGETEYTLNALPLGGFVKIYGENPDEENTTGPDASRSFVNKPRWQQALVLFAGIFANVILAWLLLSFGFLSSGIPVPVADAPDSYVLQNVHLVIMSVSKNSPAYVAGIKSGDKIISLKSGNEILSDINPETFKSFIVSHPEKQIEVGFLRGKSTNINTTNVTPVIVSGAKKPSIGVSMDQVGLAKLPLGKAFIEGARIDLISIKGTIVGLYTLIARGIRGKGSMSDVAGPVGMVSMITSALNFGIGGLFYFVGMLSVSLAVINLVPFPALDGGRLFFLLIEKIKGSRMNPKFANMANMVGFGILILLMVFVTYHDIVKLF